jgi:hypothetical protein
VCVCVGDGDDSLVLPCRAVPCYQSTHYALTHNHTQGHTCSSCCAGVVVAVMLVMDAMPISTLWPFPHHVVLLSSFVPFYCGFLNTSGCAQARRRRQYYRMVRDVLAKNTRSQCDLCGKLAGDGAKLAADTATGGVYDSHAIDKLIALFEEHHPEQVKKIDELLWVGFFRKNAEYITRCSDCRSKFEAKQASIAQERSAAKKVRDLSSDEDDTLKVTFDPLVVSRSSAVGVIMQKWLTASRRRLGGVFPRPKAAAELAAYTERMKKKALHRRAKPKGEDTLGMLVVAAKLPLSAASVAIAKKWLSFSRERIITTLRKASADMLANLQSMMRYLTPDEDWYFGSQTRMQGEELLTQGQKLLGDRSTVEEEERCVEMLRSRVQGCACACACACMSLSPPISLVHL